MRFGSFESGHIQSLDSEHRREQVYTGFRQEKELLLKAYPRAEKIHQEEAIDPRDFIDVYGRAEVERDIAYTERMEDRFRRDNTPAEKQAHQLSSIFEAIMYEEGELSDWFGPNAETILPSRYDDIVNKVDLVARIHEGPDSTADLGLALDVTFTNPSGKLLAIRNQILAGVIPRIKYFESDNLEIPRVVVGVQADTVKQLAQIWMQQKKAILGAHSVQFQILEEMREQLAAFRDFAHLKHQDRIAQAYDDRLQVVDAIYKAKNRRRDRPDSGVRDLLYRRIRDDLTTFSAA